MAVSQCSAAGGSETRNSEEKWRRQRKYGALHLYLWRQQCWRKYQRNSVAAAGMAYGMKAACSSKMAGGGFVWRNNVSSAGSWQWWRSNGEIPYRQ